MRASLALNYKLCVELYLASWFLLFLLLLNKKCPILVIQWEKAPCLDVSLCLFYSRLEPEPTIHEY